MVYYLDYDGNPITSAELERAFFITTGKYPHENKREFWKFRDRCFGKSIRQTIPADVDDFVRRGWTLHAVKLYRELNDCTLREAKDAIDTKMIEARRNGVIIPC